MAGHPGGQRFVLAMCGTDNEGYVIVWQVIPGVRGLCWLCVAQIMLLYVRSSWGSEVCAGYVWHR